MATGWFASFKDIPWTKVLNVAPSLVEGGRKLWSSVANRNAQIPKAQNAAEQKGLSASEALSAIEVRVHSLELRTTQLGEEAISSFEVVKSITEQHSQLAEQHAQLVHAVDVLLVRTRVLLWVCALLGLAVIALLLLVVSR